MQKIKLLVVDDEKRFLATCEKLLNRRGFHVLVAGSGPDALALLEGHGVQVVILDVKMPGMDGMETLKEIRRRHPQLPVIILTGHANVPSAVEAMQAGATDYLMKPVCMDRLMEKARAASEAAGLRET